MAAAITCDRCNCLIQSGHQDVLDFLKKEYPGQDICLDCDILITAAKSLQQYSLLQNKNFKEVLQMTLDIYK